MFGNYLLSKYLEISIGPAGETHSGWVVRYKRPELLSTCTGYEHDNIRHGQIKLRTAHLILSPWVCCVIDAQDSGTVGVSSPVGLSEMASLRVTRSGT